MTSLSFSPIAHIETPFPTKFGVPRQGGLVDGLRGRIVFVPAYRNADALRGLEGFTHLWLLWVFTGSLRDPAAPSAPGPAAFRPTVRPPRLGGNVRMGVFATRSPFRPNPIGLTAVRLERIEADTPQGPVLHVRGADLMDGTPILDIKPYLPYADAIAGAAGGFADAAALEPSLEVEMTEGQAATVEACIGREGLETLTAVLAQDPRPHYHADAERIYGMAFGGMEVRFRVVGKRLVVADVVLGTGVIR